MTRLIISIICAMFCATSMAQSAEIPVTAPRYHRSDAAKGVQISTDVILVALPAATITGVLFAKDWEGLKQGAFTAAATVGASILLKYTVNERRPDYSDCHSFPSAHTSITFASAAFLQRRYGWKFGGPAYALAAYVGWGRVYAGKHHWWDVAAGAAIGAGSAYIFTKPFAQKHELAIAPFTDGRNWIVSTSLTF